MLVWVKAEIFTQQHLIPAQKEATVHTVFADRWLFSRTSIFMAQLMRLQLQQNVIWTWNQS